MLVELVIAGGLGLLLLGAVMQILVIAGHKANAVDTRRDDTEQARTTLERLVHELRQSTSMTWTSSTSISYRMTVPAGLSTVSVTCSLQQCLRTEGSASLSFTGVTNTDVFCVSGQNCNDCGGQTLTTPSYVVVRLTVTGSHGSVTLCDGANLRGATLGT